MRRWLLTLLAAPVAFFGYSSGSSEPVTRDIPAIQPHAPDEIGVLTYNVQDLPWPIVGDRSQDLQRIGDRLSVMRSIGAAPQLVVLQEAFSNEPVEMLRKAGYRFIITGPDSQAVRPEPALPLAKSFLDERSLLAGEGTDPVLSSGLVIASDYPIGKVAMAAYPEGACAGFDCLANKGMMLVQLQIPGQKTPVELFNTHMNAGKKSNTPPHHNIYAYRRQLEAIDAFLAKHRDPALPAIYAGDFNVSHSTGRLVSFREHFSRWQATPVTAMGKHKFEHECSAHRAACIGELPIAANVPLMHTLDWQFVQGDRLIPIRRDAIFGLEPDGTMLSDHIGYMVRYRVKS